MRVAVVGAGYVGLVTGACLSQTGNEVTMVDADADRVATLAAGRMPFYEPGLEELIARNRETGRLSFTTDVAGAVAKAEVVFLAVGTPSLPDGQVDMQAMEAATRQVAEAMTAYVVIVMKSTVPVGTHERIRRMIAQVTRAPFDYVSNPEFLKEGAAVADFQKPDRVIVGLTSDRALRTMRHLYAPFMRRSDRLLVMDPSSAELTKYACNAMLATRVSFMNDLAVLSERVGADIEMVREGMGTDSRIGPDFLFPSLGFGGSCLPKDIRALVAMGRMHNHPMRIVEAADLVNQEQRESMFKRIQNHFGGRLSGRRFAVWGLAFKARTDDVRESAALVLVQRLVGAGATVAAHDLKAMDNAKAILGESHVRYSGDMYEALREADALVICTEWQQYRTPDFGRMKALLITPLIFDGRNLYNLDWMADVGFEYHSVGRPVVRPRPGQAGNQA
jgi:UDPglucose 6-dehydrogenase